MNKKAWSIFKENLPATLQLSGIFSAFILLVYGLLYLFGDLIRGVIMPYFDNLYFGLGTIIDVIFVVMIISFVISILSPLVYSYFAAANLLQTPHEDQVKVRTFLKTYALGMRHPIKGQLHVMSNLLYSVLIYFGLLALVVLITLGIMSSNNYLGAKDILNAVSEANKLRGTDLEAGTAALKAIMNSDEFNALKHAVGLYGNLLPVLGAFYFFIHRITVNVFRFYPSQMMGGLPAKPLNRIFKIGFSNSKKVFYKDYYGTIYPLVITFCLAFVSIYVGLSFVPRLGDQIYVMNITTMALTAIIMLPLYPVVFNLYGFIITKVGDNFLEIFIQQASYEINLMKENQAQMQNVEKTQIDNFEKFVKESRNALDEKKRQEEQKSDKKDEKKDDENSSSEK